MTFPRQAKIFHGQFNAAPMVGVLLLLLIFQQLGSLLYIPGVLMHLDNPAAVIQITADGRIQFGTNVFTQAQTNLLRDALKNSAAGPPFDLQVDPAAPPKVAAQAAEIVNSIFFIHPAAGPANLIGTDNPTVIVRVNFLGQYFYDNHIVGERELKARLRERLEAAARQSRELTLTVAGDAQVNLNAVIRLAQWAREVGIKETVLAEWPGALSAPSATPSP
jgi:biopolymer transport protein ExbD